MELGVDTASDRHRGSLDGAAGRGRPGNSGLVAAAGRAAFSIKAKEGKMMGVCACGAACCGG